jgi:flagellar basal-body rod protein FlgC
MSDFRIFDIAGSALAAQSVRLNTVASNLANADSVSADPGKVYQARAPVFQALVVDGDPALAGVKVTEVVQSSAEPQKRHEPGHPQADAQGYVYAPNVNPVEEMVNLISAARSYQSSVEVLNTTRDLMLRTLNIGK